MFLNFRMQFASSSLENATKILHLLATFVMSRQPSQEISVFHLKQILALNHGEFCSV